MLKLIDGLPPDVLGIEASGTVTHEDYQKLLIPAAETKMGEGPIKMLYVAGSDFAGYELEAMWEDAAFGFKHWHEFKRIAMVTENTWLRAAVTMFSPFFPSEIRLFKLEELAAAKDWIIGKESGTA
jgi:hypothetical protein